MCPRGCALRCRSSRAQSAARTAALKFARRRSELRSEGMGGQNQTGSREVVRVVRVRLWQLAGLLCGCCCMVA
eukprot:3242456-Pleurochrysis_carterae.AAC.2